MGTHATLVHGRQFTGLHRRQTTLRWRIILELSDHRKTPIAINTAQHIKRNCENLSDSILLAGVDAAIVLIRLLHEILRVETASPCFLTKARLLATGPLLELFFAFGRFETKKNRGVQATTTSVWLSTEDCPRRHRHPRISRLERGFGLAFGYYEVTRSS